MNFCILQPYLPQHCPTPHSHVSLWSPQNSTLHFHKINFSGLHRRARFKWHLSSCVCLISLNIMPFKLIHIVANDRIFFILWLNSIPYSYIFFIHSFSPLMDTGWFHTLVIVNNSVINKSVNISLFNIQTLFPLDLYLGMGFLDHIIVLFLSFWRNYILFSLMAILIYIPFNNVQRSLFLKQDEISRSNSFQKFN